LSVEEGGRVRGTTLPVVVEPVQVLPSSKVSIYMNFRL
jgi:hypothetical protein